MMNTDPKKGLTAAQVEESRRLHGSNQLTPPEREPWWIQLLEKFTDPLIVILVVAAVISLIPVIFVPGHSWVESAGIIGAVLLATVVGFVNEYKANKEFDILNKVNDTTPVRVIRDGKHKQVPKNEIVVGDIVLLETGEEIPADGKVLEAVAFSVNQSSLTGESEPVAKGPGLAAESAGKEGAYAADTALRGTTVTEGHAVICVGKVGDATEIGKVARAAAEENDEKSPLNQQLENLSKGINVFGFSIAFILFCTLVIHGVLTGKMAMEAGQWGVFAAIMAGAAMGMLRIWHPVMRDLLGYLHINIPTPRLVEAEGFRPWCVCVLAGLAIFGIGTGALIACGAVPPEASGWMPAEAGEGILLYFMIAITLIVVAVPEGLPMSVTLSLAYSMRKMASQNNLVRQMDACETIGAATVICSDKTGTLTLNRMTVKEACFRGVDTASPTAQGMPALAEVLAANSTADLAEDGAPLGNVTEGAILCWLKDLGIDYEAARGAFGITKQLPFSTGNKFMATYGRSAVSGKDTLCVKGAPEILLDRCTTTLQGDLTADTRRGIEQGIATAQRKAMRVIGVAYREGLPEGAADDLAAASQGLTWLGYFAIQDPVRPDVPGAVETCRKAGVGVKIVTGDNRETACQIGREIGLLPESGEIPEHSVMTGAEFGALSDEELAAKVNDLSVLSRARPMDKLRLVRTLQKQNHVVAVTGDGTNDAPALSNADVGLSMGVTGTAVAKEASDIILLDDSFSSICRAVKWGRSLYRNIQKFIVFQLTVNVAACGIAALGPFLGVELPLTVTQMLWVNLIMDTFAALALATEPPDDEVMERKPRNKQAFIITPDMWRWILWFGIAFVIALIIYVRHIRPADGGEASMHDVTILFTGFVMLQFWNLFNARVYGSTRSFLHGLTQNPAFVFIAVVILVGQVVAVHFGGDIFRTEPLSLTEWLLISVCTLPVLAIGELVRFIACRRKQA